MFWTVKVREALGDKGPSKAEYFEMMARSLHPGIVVRRPLDRVPSEMYAHVKRVADIVLSLIAIIALLPFLACVALVVKTTSPGPVLFKQKRWGRGRSQFNCYKFRTMVVETPPNLSAQEFGGKANWITPSGDFMRKWSIDELPQLVNILRGDMSFIGPRPVILREEHLVDLREDLNAAMVRPGLSGWAQINGRNLVNDEEKAFLDGEYVANMSLAFDVRIFLKTVAVVLRRSGIDHETQVCGKEEDRS